MRRQRAFACDADHQLTTETFFLTCDVIVALRQEDAETKAKPSFRGGEIESTTNSKLAPKLFEQLFVEFKTTQVGDIN